MDRYQAAAKHASQIEQELRAIGAWREGPLPAEAYQFQRAFAADTMSFYQWIQFVLLARIRSIIAERGTFPSGSNVAAYAVRELDGVDEAASLIEALGNLDDFISKRRN